MKKNIIILLTFVSLILVVFLFYFNLNNNQTSNDSSNVNWWKVVKQDPFESKSEKEKEELIKEDKTVQEKLKNVNRPLQNMLKTICSWKQNIQEVTCDPFYKTWEPRIYAFILSTSKKNDLEFDDIVTFLYNNLNESCLNLSEPDKETLLQFIKSNDSSCTLDLLENMNKIQKDVKKFVSKNNISKENIHKPFEFYYLNKKLDSKEQQLKTLIIDLIRKDIAAQWLQSDQFEKNVLDYIDAENVTNLQNIIIEKYTKIFNDYNLSKYELKIDWYTDYFKRNEVIRKNKSSFAKLILNNEFQKSYKELIKYISIYTYLSKNYFSSLYEAEVSFWKKWVWLVNLLELYRIINHENK